MTKVVYERSHRPVFVGLGFAALGVASSIFLARQQAEHIDLVESARLVHATNSMTEVLVRRMDAYVEVAFGLQGLFIINPPYDRRSFSGARSGSVCGPIKGRQSGIFSFFLTHAVA
jgi:hypothetical protein